MEMSDKEGCNVDRLEKILSCAAAAEASDVHLTTGRPPILRINGELKPLDSSVGKLTPADIEAMAEEILDPVRYQKFSDLGEIDFSYSVHGLGRFRVNIFKQRGTAAMAIRLIRSSVPTVKELGLPEAVTQLTRKQRGLILVTGPTGSGKSTTLAAMINQINAERACHIITLEDPIEYLHSHQKSIVNQREIGQDSKSFAAALRAAMREDPDVILVGEMRDLDTIATAITAAETGHLVLATLHTTSAPLTIERIIDVFPAHQQQQIKMQLSNTVQGVICQQLLPRKDGRGRVAALEIMVATPAVRNLIREGKNHQIISQIQTGAKYGMQTMEAGLKKLVQNNIISPETAKLKAIEIGL